MVVRYKRQIVYINVFLVNPLCCINFIYYNVVTAEICFKELFVLLKF